MTLTTRCPSCNTVFKVAQDQLRLAEGWVRCGRCEETFEAQDALAQWQAGSETSAAQVPPSPAKSDEVQADWFTGSEWTGKSKPAAPPKPWVTAAWAVAGSISLASLLVQAALAWHDELAHAAPILRPVLEVACVMAECRIEPARKIEALTIESSQLTQLGGTVYQFSVTVRNRAAVDLTPPTLDLVLTGQDGEIIARRALRWADFGLRTRSFPAQKDLNLQAHLNTGSTAVSGFTIELFYP
ncbi:MAG: zinc-ribbon and DUF3426 domain-containing protein [Betaproteobacteria bacterium]|jgi:predicted Zn finger-like uncharacterized protein